MSTQSEVSLVDFHTPLDHRTLIVLEGEQYEAWISTLVRAIQASQPIWHQSVDGVRVELVYRPFFPYRKWLIFDLSLPQGKLLRLKVVNVEFQTDHPNVPIINSKLFPSGIAGGEKFVGWRYFDAVELRDHVRQLTGIHFSVELHRA